MKRNYDNKFILGLDLGVGSVGWSCVEIDDDKQPKRIIAANSFIFDEEEGSLEDRRNARGQRRLTRRRKNRLKYIKKMFIDYGYIDKDRMKEFFIKEACNYEDPYHIKVKGLHEKLNYEELLIALVHYGKHRGFKSNRKKDEIASNGKSASDDQKLLYAISETEKIMKDKNQTISEFIIDNHKFDNKIRNTDGNYHLGIKRSMIVDEANQLLDKQIELGVITEEFKDRYLELLEFQRSFSKGPDKGPWSNSLERMIGKCGFDGKERAPKNAPSYEIFKMLQDLANIKYDEYNDDGKLASKDVKLSKEEKQKLILEALNNNKKITYKVIKKVINKDNIKFKGVTLLKKDYDEIRKKKQTNPELDDYQLKEDIILKKEINNSKLNNYVTIKNSLKPIEKLSSNNIKLMDQITVLLSKYKTDDEITMQMRNFEEINKKDELFKSVILNINTQYMKDFGKLSLDLIYKILPLMFNDGKDYSEALNEIGYDHSIQKQTNEIYNCLPPVEDMIDELDLSMTNRKVVATIKNAQLIINKIIEVYGRPHAIHVEMARDLTKTDTERAKALNESYMNQIGKITIKQEILSQYGDIFKNIQDINYDSLLKYKLAKEQNWICPYTLALTGDESKAKINARHLFSDDYQIDHIIPYSKSYNDKFYNKVLVKTETNQNKSNRIPMEYFNNSTGIELYKEWVNKNIKSYRKRQYLLAEKISDDMINEFRARAINDTRYVSKVLVEMLNYYFHDIKIRVYNGQMTDKMKGIWGVKNLTHSYQSENYILNQDVSQELQEKYNQLSKLSINNEYFSDEAKQLKQEILKLEKERDKKNRANHLHHALDATVIACLTDSLKIKIQQYDQYLRMVKDRADNNIGKEILVDVENPETGEITTNKIVVHSEHEFFDQTKIAEKRFPRPYPEFSEEVKYRIFERDEATMKKRLSLLDNYDVADVQEAEVLQVMRKCDKKIQGRMHKDTIYGGAKNPNNSDEVVLTSRINVNSESFKTKELEKIYDKDKTQKQIYEAVKEWLGDYANGALAYAAHQGYPKSNNGNDIVKVKIDYGKPKEEILLRPEYNQYVEKENVVRVDIYKKEGDDKLYFVGMDRYRCLNEKSDQNLMLWYGQGKSNIVVKKSELSKLGFSLYKKIYKNQLIKIKMKNNNKECLATSTGFTSGMFEIKSLIGDDYDLNAELDIKLERKQKQLTVSTISDVEIVKANILGQLI